MGHREEFWCDKCGKTIKYPNHEIRLYDNFPDKCFMPLLCKKCYEELKESCKNG